MQAFAFGRIDKARPIKLPPAGRVRHHRLLHQAVRLLPPHPARRRGDVRPAQRREHHVRGHQEGRGRDLQDRRRARACAVGRFRQRAIELPVSDGARGALPRHQVRALRRQDAQRSRRSREFARKLTITAPAEIDQLYPRLRPARVTVTTPNGKFIRQADEAWGSRLVPLDDAGLVEKFCGLVAPVLRRRAREGAVRAAVGYRGRRERRDARRGAGEVGLRCAQREFDAHRLERK